MAGSALWAAWALLRRDGFALAPLVAVGLAYLLARTDEFHLVPLSVVLAVALACAAGREANAPLRAALGVALALVAVHGLERRVGQARHPPALAAIPAEAADGVRTAPADAAALRALIPYVRARAPGGAPVLVAPPRYDRVRVGDPMLNVLLDRPNPTRYDVVQPGSRDDGEGPARDGARPARGAGRRALALGAGARARAQRVGEVERRVRPRPRDRPRLPAGEAVR